MNYQHTQTAPLYLILFGFGSFVLVLCWILRDTGPGMWITLFVAVVLFTLELPSARCLGSVLELHTKIFRTFRPIAQTCLMDGESISCRAEDGRSTCGDSIVPG